MEMCYDGAWAVMNAAAICTAVSRAVAITLLALITNQGISLSVLQM